ncbi:hypothetical protein MOSE0_I00892 [Monosporozyma servazzii]
MSTNAAHQLLTMSNTTTRRLSREEIINKMENEQDAIVIKLLREIDQLKRENNSLKSTVNYLSKKHGTDITNLPHHNFDTDDESAIIIDNNTNFSLYTPSHSRKSSMTSSNNNNTTIYPVETRQRNVSISSASSNEHHSNNNNNRPRRRASSSIYSNIR